MILAAVVVYKAPKKDRSVTEGITWYDIGLTSRAQYIIAMQIDKNSALEDLECIRQVLVSRKSLSCAYFCTIFTYGADTNGRLVRRKCSPYQTSFKALED